MSDVYNELLKPPYPSRATVLVHELMAPTIAPSWSQASLSEAA